MNQNPLQEKNSQPSSTPYIDKAEVQYRRSRRAFWDDIFQEGDRSSPAGRFYRKLLIHYYRFFVPPGMKVLEIGCGQGDLLAALEPSLGVGLDFSNAAVRRAAGKYPYLLFIQADSHELPFREKFDVIIMSDLVNDLWDVQTVFEELKSVSHSGTRVILNLYNNLWRIPLSIARFFRWATKNMEQNWLTPNDISNLLALSEFETIKQGQWVLLPLNIPILAGLANRYLVHLWPFKHLALTNMIVARPVYENVFGELKDNVSVSVIVPARNEAGNIEKIIRRVPAMGKVTEIIFIEGGSEDDTYEVIQRAVEQSTPIKCRLFKQKGMGKGDAVRLGFDKAEGDILMILDADMTVPPKDLPRFLEALISGKGDFINGVRLVYPLESQSMRFINIFGNKFFSIAFSWLLGHPLKDTLCGTKVLRKADYDILAKNRHYFGEFDPFGDFDLIFGAAKLNLKIVEMPVRYRTRTYGETNIDRFRHGWLLMKMVWFAARRIKFI
jgi:SAM-dependent methyltransferase